MLRAWSWALLFLTMAAGTLWGGPDTAGTEPKEGSLPEVDVRFLDGSAARVFIVQESIDLETKYGKLTIPCRDLRRIELGLRVSPSTDKRIEEAIRQLGSTQFSQRETGSKELLKLAIPAYHALKKAPTTKDPEVAQRTQAILKQIEKVVPADRLQGRPEDRVQTREFTVTGRITGQTLKVRSRYFGETDLKISELDSFRLLATLPFARRAGIHQAAYLMERGDFFAAKKTAEEFAKGKEVEHLASMFRLRRRGGLGIGNQPNVINPDGIEALIIQMSGKRPMSPSLLNTHSADLARAFYLTAAIAEAHRGHCPVKQKTKNKDPKDWEKWSVGLRDASLELATAVQERHPAKVREVTQKVNNFCSSCHEVFRDCGG